MLAKFICNKYCKAIKKEYYKAFNFRKKENSTTQPSKALATMGKALLLYYHKRHKLSRKQLSWNDRKQTLWLGELKGSSVPDLGKPSNYRQKDGLLFKNGIAKRVNTLLKLTKKTKILSCTCSVYLPTTPADSQKFCLNNLHW